MSHELEAQRSWLTRGPRGLYGMRDLEIAGVSGVSTCNA